MTGGTGMTGGPPAVAAALRRALSAEQAAVYGYGVLGAHLSWGPQASAITGWKAHQQARDDLGELLQARGIPAPSAAVGYQLPGPAGTAAQARSLAVLIEDRVAAAYLGVVALSERSLREFGARQLRAAALRAAAWRGGTIAFPGFPGTEAASQPSAVSRGRPAPG
ncbi:MAG: ferritin-like domain-containing protein [Streptosporangiaceae bacterium]